MRRMLRSISLCLFFLSSAWSLDKVMTLTSNPPGTGVSTGANVANISVNGNAFVAPFCPSGSICTAVAIATGTFTASGTVDYTSARTLLPVTVTLANGTITLAGTIQFNQGTFNSTNGGSVQLSQYGVGNGQIVITSVPPEYVGVYTPDPSKTISVTCASGGTLNQPCPANFTFAFTTAGTSASSPPPIPIPSTLILSASGLIVVASIIRKKWRPEQREA